MKLSRTAIAAVAALGAVTRPKLTAPVDFSGAFDGITKANLQPKALAKKLHALVKPKLAQDVDLTPAELAEIVENATAGVDDMDAEQALDEDETEEEKAARLKKQASDEGKAEAEEKGKKDLEKEDKQPTEKKTAMDSAAIQAAVKQGEARAVARFNAIRQAEREVAPHVGEVVAMDSAAAVYRLALDAARVDVSGVPEEAYGAMVRMLPKPGSTPAPVARVAMDSSGVADFKTRFPTAVTPAQGF